MKKKGSRTVPDFSRKKPGRLMPIDTRAAGPQPKPPRVNVGKPPATSSKSGRRGS